MMHGPTPNPWLFRRDELDIVEEEFDEIFRRHDKAGKGMYYAFEEDVLKEHLDTEEVSEAELINRLGPQWFAAEHHHANHEHAHPESDAGQGSLRDQLRRESVRDPLYELAFLWATRVFRWSGRVYETPAHRSRDVFRAHVNAYLVPAKIAAAQAEEAHEEREAMEVALREYELASTYLERTRESLRGLLSAPFAIGHASVYLEESDVIARRLVHIRKRLEDMRSFRTPL